VWEVILAGEKECGLHPPDGQDLSTELDKICMCMDRIDAERAIEARWLSQLAVEISNTLVDLGMLPV
jgi:hypothetical protein